MPIIYHNGDLFNCGAHIIGHQTNGRGVMGAGLAADVRRRYPAVYDAYVRYCYGHDPKSLLGTNLLVCEDGRPGAFYDGNGVVIANLFGQAYTSRTHKMTDEDAVLAALTRLAAYARSRNLNVALPYKMGCNLGGGDWNVIEALIAQAFHDYPVVICKR